MTYNQTRRRHRRSRTPRTGEHARRSRLQRRQRQQPHTRHMVLGGLALLVIVFWTLRRDLPDAPAGPLLPAGPPAELATTYTGIRTGVGLIAFVTVRLARHGPGAGVSVTYAERDLGSGTSTSVTYTGTIQSVTVQASDVDLSAQPPVRTAVVLQATSFSEAVLRITQQDGSWDAAGHLRWLGLWRPLGAPLTLQAVRRYPAPRSG